MYIIYDPSIDNWIKETKSSPFPAEFKLASIVELFTERNLNHIPLDPDDPTGEMVNATLLKELHQQTFDTYCDLVLGEPCPVEKSCHIWNDCKTEETCIEDRSEKGFTCLKGCKYWNDCKPEEQCFDSYSSNTGFFCKRGELKFFLNNSLHKGFIVKVDGNWGEWGSWSSCSETCGSSGVKKRTRRCDNPSPAHGGDNCAGSSRSSENCNTHTCPGKLLEDNFFSFKIFIKNF